MPLSLNEIKDRALAFSREWDGEKEERAEAQTFWNEFFNVFGISWRRLESFEEPVKRPCHFLKKVAQVDNGCLLKRHGSNHDIFMNPQNGKKTPDPRYPEIKDSLCKLIKEQLGLT